MNKVVATCALLWVVITFPSSFILVNLEWGKIMKTLEQMAPCNVFSMTPKEQFNFGLEQNNTSP